jgi:hypothetical protein
VPQQLVLSSFANLALANVSIELSSAGGNFGANFCAHGSVAQQSSDRIIRAAPDKITQAHIYGQLDTPPYISNGFTCF